MFQIINKKSSLVALILTFSQLSMAGLLTLTPGFGYQNQNLKLIDISDATSEVKMTSPHYSLKLGIISAAGIGLDFVGGYTSGKAKTTAAGVETETKFTHTVGSAQLSVTAMNSFKIFLGYILMNDLVFKDSSTNQTSKLKGPGYQVGLSYNITQSIALSAQYDIYQFNQIYLDSSGKYEDIKTYFKKIDAQSTSASLSISF